MLIMKIRPATVDDVEAIAAVIEPFVDYVVVTEEGRERFKPDMLKKHLPTTTYSLFCGRN